jgi:hypothetical protein
MVARLSPSIHLLDVRQLPKSRLVIFYWARRRHKSTVKPPILTSAAVPLAAWGPLADIADRLRHVRFTPESRHRFTRRQCPLSAIRVDFGAFEPRLAVPAQMVDATQALNRSGNRDPLR